MSLWKDIMKICAFSGSLLSNMEEKSIAFKVFSNFEILSQV